MVLGATGRIGALLRRRWPDGGVLWQARAPIPGAGPHARPRQEPGLRVFDPLAEPGALAAAATGRAVILCLAGVVPARAAQGADMADNIRLAEAAVRAGAVSGARVILISSAAVYGARTGVCDEDMPVAPVSEYGRAKALMEARGATLGAQLGVPVTSLRIGNVAGFDAILGGWRPGFGLDRFADGRTPRRSYVGPATLARVLGALVGHSDLPGVLPGVLNLAAPGVVEMGALLDAAGLDWTPRPAPRCAIAEVRLNTDRLARLVALPARDGLAPEIVAEWRDDGQMIST